MLCRRETLLASIRVILIEFDSQQGWGNDHDNDDDDGNDGR